MKLKTSIILLVIITTQLSLAQNDNIKFSQIQIELGYSVFWNSLNGDYYYEYKTSLAPNSSGSTIGGINLAFSIPTRINYLDLCFGSFYLRGLDEYSSGGWTPGNTRSSDYLINGGGIYFGISPKLKTKYFGISTEYSIGVFSFKEYIAIFNNTREPYIDAYDRKASYGLGAKTSLGMYVKFGRFGIHPKFEALFSGGSDASFMFYGGTLPLTIRF